MLGRYRFWDKIMGDPGRSNEDETTSYCAASLSRLFALFQATWTHLKTSSLVFIGRNNPRKPISKEH